MLKVEINGRKGIVEVEGEGTIPEMMADITALLGCMYEGIDKDQKENFKNCLKHLVDDEIYLKNEEEIKELNKKKDEEIKEKLKKELEEFINGLFGKKE